MGTFTQIYVNVQFKTETPGEVLRVIRTICDESNEEDVNAGSHPHLLGRPRRWSVLFRANSYSFNKTRCAIFELDQQEGFYHLIGKGDIKNYHHEIEEFFEFIKPWCENNLIGYYMHENDKRPTLVYVSEPIDLIIKMGNKS